MSPREEFSSGGLMLLGRVIDCYTVWPTRFVVDLTLNLSSVAVDRLYR